MDGYEVVIAELRKAGGAAVSAGEQAAAVDLGAAISGVSAALPGSRSAQAVVGLADAWGKMITQWSEAATRHGQGMSSSADLYSTNDKAAEQDLSLNVFDRIGLF